MRDLESDFPQPSSTDYEMEPRLVADKVLADCKRAFDKLEKCPVDDAELRRILYVAVVALLRAVGHVLDKVDACVDAEHKTIIAEAYEELKSHPENYYVFHEFIEKERNNVLKQYLFAAENLPSADYFVSWDSSSDQNPSVIQDLILIEDGFYQGRDVRSITKLAILFWEEYLDHIKARLM